MIRRIQFLAVFLLVCFGVLFLQLNNLQVRQASSLQQRSVALGLGATNVNDEPRGAIVSSDGAVLAESKSTKKGELRIYPQSGLFASVTGAFDVANDANQFGVEAEYNSYLIQHQSSSNSLDGLLTQHAGTDTVALTVSDKVQRAAQNALAGKIGAVVAIDPSTGAILAMYSNPTYDPNKLASLNAKAVNAYYQSLDPNSGSSPLVNLATDRPYPPGSTFKVITTAAIYDHMPSIANQTFPSVVQIKIPETDQPFHNFGGERCGGNLPTILSVSCDTAYAEVGLQLGASNLSREATAFGLNKTPPIDLPGSEVAPSCFPPVSTPKTIPGCLLTARQPIGKANEPFVAYSAIGQGNVSETALEDALVAAGIGNHGTIMKPHLLDRVIDSDGRVVTTYKPSAWLHATSQDTADMVRSLMLGVVDKPGGTAYGLFPANLHVAAKTGTAETGTACSDTWLIATGPAGPGDIPRVAVAAVVPAQAKFTCSSESTGARVAGPIVRDVLEAALGAS